MKRKNKSRLVTIIPIITIVGLFLTVTDVGVSIWKERANVSISFGNIDEISEFLREDYFDGFYSEIKVSNFGNDIAKFDLIVEGENAQIKFEKQEWGETAKLSVSVNPEIRNGVFKIYILPDENSETFTIKLLTKNPSITFQQIEQNGNQELTYKRTPEGNYLLVK